ncbi:ROK family protein [Pseudacidobacterium ailaaui]|jgi:polyphosphate glucokinase|uniref:ROK family protein n=1 Tax=Pseudacidobacterium ailaaui TaxID=1382359 RepID=UPI00047A1CB6|nr:ROK family protein [Pseudacidobacterium ailaaui]MBX6358688.1 ROK family protein [Pseudacidobacterium ailaaui]MDI3254027.1 ROK family protein [Bacillota bacterium]
MPKKNALNTLCIDIGGTGLKIMVLDKNGNPLTERLRIPTPADPTPAKVIAALDRLKKKAPEFDRVAVGFPGVVKLGVLYTAANLHPKWVGFNLQAELEKRWKKPVRVANDAAVQGYAAIRGQGVEMILTLGTGLGSALYTDGHLCPGLELAHHPWMKGKTYEDYLGKRGLKKHGHKRWNKLLAKAIQQTSATFNWDHLYIGGGNAKLINFPLGENIEVVSNEDGLLGGVALWKHNA